MYVVKKSDLPDDFLRYIPGGSFIGYIIPDGATDRAGLKIGDVVFTIKGNEIKFVENDVNEDMTLDFLKYFRGLPRGEAIPYEVLRGNENLTIDVWLSTFGISTTIFFVILCGLCFIALGIFYGLKRPNLVTARIISVTFIILGFNISSSLGANPPDFDIFAFIRLYLTNSSLFLIFPLIFHSLLYFPGINTHIVNNKRYIRTSYLIALVSVIIFSYFYFVDYMALNSGFMIYFILLNLVYYLFIRIFFRKFELSENRKVSRIINLTWLLIIFINFAPFLLGLFRVKVPSYYEENDFFLLFLIPIAYLYFTWRYRLLDIDLRLKRNIQYLVLTALLKSIFFIIFIFLLWKVSNLNIGFPKINISLSSIEISSVPLDKTANIFYNKLFFILIAFISGTILYRIGMRGQNFLDKKFYREKFNYKYAQEELLRLFQSKFTIESLAQIIVEKVATLVRIKYAGVVFTGDGKRIWEGKIFCFDNQKSASYEMMFDKNIIDAMKGYKGTFSINYLPEDLKVYFEVNNFAHIIPIRTNERLLGALFIGEKLAETPLKGEDFEFLSSLVTSTSVAVENAFLYEELTKRERFKKELEIAHNIQIASLPQHVPVVPGLDIFATSVPATEVGGDFYDFLDGKANGITIVMGDVSGKGTSAALYMSKVQGIFQTLHEFNLSPIKLMIRANQLLYKHIDSKSYITAIGANFNTELKSLCFARAGHLPLYYFSNRIKEIRKIQPSGIGLGLSEKNIFDFSIEEIKIEYFTGDIFLFISDGVTEALNRAGEQFGEQRLLELVKNNHESDSKNLVDNILESVQSFSSDTNQFDDITVVVVKSV